MQPRDTQPHAPQSGDGEPRYSIGELAVLGGVNRRTVRYYVQRGLLAAPAGAGRGSHYTQRHLDTLIRIRELQESGTPLAEIPARLAGREPAAPAATLDRPSYSRWTRISLGDGVEIHLRDARLDSEQAHALAEAVARIIPGGGRP